MSGIYRIDGTMIPGNGYSVDGSQLDHVYNIGGEDISNSEDGTPLTVMSYNIQKWTNMNGWKTLQDGIFVDYDADVVGFQEYVPTASIDGQAITSYLEGYFPGGVVNYVTVSSLSFGGAIASKTALTNHTYGFYSEPGNNYTVSTEPRGWQKAYITKDGKQIAIFNTHFSWYGSGYTSDARAVRAIEAQELIEQLEKEPYFILTIDSNTNATSMTDEEYTQVAKLFADKGYNMANWQDFGFLVTCTESYTSTESTFWEHIDNIICSSNITIDSVTVDDRKIAASAGNYAIDHLPLIAKLTIR